MPNELNDLQEAVLEALNDARRERVGLIDRDELLRRVQDYPGFDDCHHQRLGPSVVNLKRRDLLLEPYRGVFRITDDGDVALAHALGSEAPASPPVEDHQAAETALQAKQVIRKTLDGGAVITTRHPELVKETERSVRFHMESLRTGLTSRKEFEEHDQFVTEGEGDFSWLGEKRTEQAASASTTAVDDQWQEEPADEESVPVYMTPGGCPECGSAAPFHDLDCPVFVGLPAGMPPTSRPVDWLDSGMAAEEDEAPPEPAEDLPRTSGYIVTRLQAAVHRPGHWTDDDDTVIVAIEDEGGGPFVRLSMWSGLPGVLLDSVEQIRAVVDTAAAMLEEAEGRA